MAGITGRDAEGLSLNLQETKKKEISDFKVGVLLESSCCVQDNELTDQLQVAIDSLAALGVNIDDKVKPVADLGE